VVAAAAMGAAFMVSYARSKSEGLGFSEGTGMAAVGIMPREVRLIVLSGGLIIAGLTGGISPGSGGSGWLVATLAVIAIGATITVIQRIVFVRRQAKSDPNLPQ
jgi:hypothetical protein